jgi:hypothetical protein
MANFLAAWILAPLLLIVISLALGALIRKRLGSEPNPIFILASGFSLLIVIGAILTNFSFSARFTTPLILVLSIFSLVKNFSFIKNLGKNLFSFAVIKVAFIFAGLPVISTFKVSWPGWVQLDDTATFLAITNHIMNKGHSVPENLVSTYDRTLQVVLGGSFYGTYNADTNTSIFSYPVGSLIPLGVTGQISRIDLAWIYFPYLAFGVALTAGLLFLITSKFFSNRWLAAAVAITTAHAATFYAYALWGGIKEVALVPVLLLSLLVYQNLSRANLLPILLVSATIYAIGGKSGIGFIIAELALFLAFKYLKDRINFKFKKFLIPTSLILLLLVLLSGFISDLFNKYLIPEIPDSGNLARPVNNLQIFGMWPSGDFRNDIYWQPFSYIGLALIISITAYGLWRAFRSNETILVVGLLTTLSIAIYSLIFSGVWLTGKAIAVASPFVLLVTFFGISQLISKYQKIGSLLIAFTIFGVATSNYLAYRHTWIAPSEKVQELQTIGKKFKDEGPALLTEYAVFGARYFLRDLQAESASELRVNPILMRDGKELQKGFAADIDLFDNSAISPYKLLVLKHTGSASRPLFNYDLAYEGKYYDVWKQNNFGNTKIKSIPLGNNYFPSETPRCSTIKELTANAPGKIYAAERKPTSLSSLSDGQLQPNWIADQGNPGAVIPVNGGYLQGIVEVDKTADYQWFIGGSYPGKLKIFLDQKLIFTGHTFFEGNKYLSNYLFTSEVTAGKHLLEIRYSKPLLKVGAGANEAFGPIYLSSETAAQAKVISASQGEIEKLCNKNLDWIAWIER